ncbi:hypothetical protein I7I50_01052 [Histoplasma capsulatum G186AR]|uniref:Uncharacterized protein n=1 Tax=Ajellomyces capsulatus TaxID=5037 RepID=A0A8H7YEU8_AJECA|nr:hypothetical protein I7I52_08318 [Histoplasma capsulatum]QSS73027.1 hypothetical protein I7I50_01052 [Histoplasma capsulatum G186AR]
MPWITLLRLARYWLQHWSKRTSGLTVPATRGKRSYLLRSSRPSRPWSPVVMVMVMVMVMMVGLQCCCRSADPAPYSCCFSIYARSG